MSMDVGGKGPMTRTLARSGGAQPRAHLGWTRPVMRSEINVTPLVDVVLVLLIVFMVVTPMLQRGKPVVLPDARHVSALTRGGDPILVSVTRDGRLWIDQEEVQRQDLARRVGARMRLHPGAAVLVRGDRDVEYRVVREVIRELSKTRLAGVSLAATQAEGR
ncbi:ExbD/TolR family protein [Anaeromyxobacter oryzisoli]|uniref:ExbD/TolR family protein n=1 Tax=Anaeromyxobacter oryzisoli TaxID=2925408 RepID=UPI001F597C4A|nr:biopolymer transporter ExbD [Anaeromyxobacter sp. SG63]